MSKDFADSAQVEYAFYEAFQKLDLELMKALWIADDNCYCVHPGGQLLVGARDVLKSWWKIFESAKPPIVSYEIIDKYIANGVAVHLVQEQISANGLASDASQVLATNTYQRVRGEWRMVGHHASLQVVSPKSDLPGQVLH